MKRSSYRLMMIFFLLVLAGASYFVFRLGQKKGVEIEGQRGELTRLQQELENAAKLSAALTELDQITINEKTATQLDILRHLGLEQSDIEFSVAGRQGLSVGGSTLYTHSVQIRADMAYPAALYLVDKLHNTRKFILSSLNLRPGGGKGGSEETVQMILQGKVYGLDKQEGPRP